MDIDTVPNLNLQRVFGSQQEGRSHKMSGEVVTQEDQGVRQLKDKKQDSQDDQEKELGEHITGSGDQCSNGQGTTTSKVRLEGHEEQVIHCFL